MNAPAERIAVVSQPRLAARYGESAASLLEGLAALPGTRLAVSGSADADGIRRDLQAELMASPDAGVLLVGGPQTMPFFEVPFQGLDEDPAVGTDNPYGVPGTSTALADIALPSRAVGRIPDHPADTAATFAGRVAALCAPLASPGGAGTWYVLSAKEWKGTTTAINARLGTGAAIDLAPPRAPSNFADPSFVQPAARRQLYNLHGSDREKFWYGQDGGKYPPAMSPDAVASLGQQGRVAGALVVSQACYGAFLLMPGGLRSVRDACSLQFLELGAAGFLGSTTIAYGGTTGAMVCSDVLAVEFLRAASQGLPLGQALQQARRGLASSVRSPPGGAELKTLLQFVLYGDPTRTWITAAAPKTLAGGVESLTGDAETRALFAEYAAWSEEAAAPKTLGARAEGFDEGWTETARFSAGAGPKGLLSAESATRPQRRVLQKVNELPREDVLRDGASSHRVVYFREVVTRADGSTQDAVSTGGRSAATIEEERGGAAPWWRQPALAATGPATGRPKRGAPAPKAKRKPARSASKKRGSAARPKKGRSKR